MTRKMKDSGVEWIGEIPENWQIGRIKFATQKIGSGKTPKGGSDVYSEAGILFIRSQNVYNEELKLDESCYISNEIDTEMKATRVFYKDVLLNITGGSIGRCCLYLIKDKHANVNQHVCIIRSDSEILLPAYICYFWQSPAGEHSINIYQSGANREGMNFEQIGNSYIPYATLEEQEKIVAYLDNKCYRVDEVISREKHLVEKLKDYKQSMITEAVTKGLNPEVKLKASGVQWIGDIPEHWNVRRLKYLFKIRKDIAGKLGYDILSVTQNGIKIKDISKNDGQLAMDYSKYQLVNRSDFIMNHMDLLTGFVDCSKFEGVTSPDYRVFRLLNDENGMAYYKYLFQSCYFNKVFYGLGQGVSGLGRWRLQTDKFLNFCLPIPPFKEQEDIAEYIDKKCTAIDSTIALKEKLIEKLAEYKKSLIYEYVTGKRTV